MTSDVVVHPNVDMDAIACIVACGIGTRVHYVPAGAKELPQKCACHGEPILGARILDHALGDKGRLDPDGTRHAALLSMPETKDWHPGVLAEIDEQDSTGKVEHPRFSLSYLLMAAKAYCASLYELARPGEEVSTQSIDESVIMVMRPIIAGLNIIQKRLVEARERALSIMQVQVGPYKIAIPAGGDPPFQVAEILNKEHGCSLQIYHDGFNLGVFRYPGHEKPDLRKLEERLPGWFVHTAGFLACWGSKKSPATEPPPKGTPQNAGELVELLTQAFA